jgi:hypothetical protein
LKNIYLNLAPDDLDHLVFPKLTCFRYVDHMWAQPASVVGTMCQFLSRGVCPALLDLEFHGPLTGFPSGLHLTRLVLNQYSVSADHVARFPSSLRELRLPNVTILPRLQPSFLRAFRHLTRCSQLVFGLNEFLTVDLTPPPTID